MIIMDKIKNLICLNQKGQFFSPDLVIAVGVFVFGLALFFSSSNSIFYQAELFDLRKESDELGHTLIDSLVLSGGSPSDWETYNLVDINSFGLARSPNFLTPEKIHYLVNNLNDDTNYILLKERLGFGKFDLQINLIGSNGVVLVDGISLSGGRLAEDRLFKLVYNRAVYYNSQLASLEAVITYEE